MTFENQKKPHGCGSGGTGKLGFRREKIRLYYPLSTLNHLLGTQDTAEQMEVTLAGQPESMTIKLGKLAVSRKGDRFCLCIPEEGSAYVHEHFAEKGFIYELIRLIGQHDCKMEDIRQLFCGTVRIFMWKRCGARTLMS